MFLGISTLTIYANLYLPVPTPHFIPLNTCDICAHERGETVLDFPD